MASKIQLRRDTAANWTATNPTLAQGEPGLETDTGKIKYGDGTTAWVDLSYAGGTGTELSADGAVSITAGSTAYWVAGQRRDNFDMFGKGLRHDSEGNVYTLTGSYNDNGANVSVVTKYSTAGAVLWQKSFTNASASSLAIDSNDCAYASIESGSDAHLIKFDTDGSILWEKSYDAGAWDGEGFVEERSSTSIILTANRDGANGVLVLDINAATGEVTTQKIIGNGTDGIYAGGIDTDADGNVFVTGKYYDAGVGKWKMYVEKLDTNLDRVWSKSLESPNNYDMIAGDCASDAQGNVYAIAFYDVDTVNPNGTGSQTAGVLIKLDSVGDTAWSRRLGPGPCGQSVVGLTATDAGDLYLATTTVEFEKTNKQLQDYQQMAESTARMIVAKYNTQGDVLWQRYIDSEHVWEDNNDFRGQTISVFDDKFVVDFHGTSSNTIPWNFSGSSDNEDDYFLIQLPTDGTEITIGDVDFKESRIPGRFVTHTTTASPTTLDTFTDSLTTSDSSLTPDTNTAVANVLVTSETYEYKFGADGTLTIPNDGDVKLTQTQVGWIGAVGTVLNYDNDYEGYASAVDSQGYVYVTGYDGNNNAPYVAKFTPEGGREWSVAIEDNNNGYNGRGTAIALHPTTGNVIVGCEIYGNYNYSALVTVDQDTGRVLSNVEYKDTENDLYIQDIKFTSTNEMILVGSKNGNFTPNQTVTAQAGSTNQKIVVLRSEVTGTVESYWQIGGDGFSVPEQINVVEQYSNLTGTTDQGSGAQFQLADNGDGTYGIGSPTAAGSGYKVGHKIKVLGTDVGGTTPTNDVVVTIGEVDGNGGVTAFNSPTGTAAGSSYTLYTVSGTNYQIGSGFGFSTYNGPTQSSNYNDYNGYNISSYGADYVVGDVIRIAGTDLGGTSPTNDMILTVASIGGSGEANGFNISGTAQSTNWNIITNTNVDFSQAGNWYLTQPLSRENILMGDGWLRTYGTNTGDRTDKTWAVAIDSDDNIITVGLGYGETATDDNNDLAVVYKFNSTGTLQWSRRLNEINYDCEAMGVTTIGTDIYVTHYSDDNGETIITKLLYNGNAVWQRRTNSNDNCVIANSGDGNLIVAAECYNDEIGETAIKLFKMSPGGDIVYKRWLHGTVSNSTYLMDGQSLAVANGSMYIAGEFYADDYYSLLVAKLPVDGSGTGEYGHFRYVDVNAQNGNYNYPDVNSDNYSIEEIVDLEANSRYGNLTVDPYVNDAWTDWSAEGDYYVYASYPDYSYEEIRDTQGGKIIFADGTTQETSATDIPQRIYRGAKYTLGMGDRGHHIYCTDQNDYILIPYDARVPFPIGTTITIVNDTGDTVWIQTEGSGTSLMMPGNGYGQYVGLDNYGIATLLKIGREKWVISGNVYFD